MGDTRVTWIDGMQFLAESAGHGIVVDGAPGFGQDTGIPPMRLLLLGAAGCSAMDVIHVLKNRMHKDVSGLNVEVSSEQAEEHPKVYTRIEFSYRVAGKGLREKDVRRAIELSHTRFCSAAIMLAKTAEIVTRFEIEESQ